MSEMICNIDERPYSFFNAGIKAGSSYAIVDGLPQNPTTIGDGFEILIFSPEPFYPAVIFQEKKYFPRIRSALRTSGTNMPSFQNFSITAKTFISQALYIVKEKALKIIINKRQYEADLYVQCNVGGNEFLVDSADVSLVIKPNDDRLAE